MRDDQGPLHAESLGPPRLCLPTVSDPQQDYQCPSKMFLFSCFFFRLVRCVRFFCLLT